MTQLKDSKANKSLARSNSKQESNRSGSARQHAFSSPKKANRLWIQLLWRVLPIVVLPMTVAAGAGWWIIHENIENQYRTRLREHSLLAAESMRERLSGLLETPERLANNPLVVESVREGSDQVITENLNALSVEELEKQFNETKRLQVNPILSNYVKQLAGAESIGEIIITEQNGLNVAYSQVTSDFVQRDETWWQNGQTQEQLIGDLEYDASTGKVLMQITQRIQSSETDEFLGIVRVGFPRSTFQVVDVYLEQASLLETGQVQVLNTSLSQVLVTVTQQGALVRDRVEGGEAIIDAGQILVDTLDDPESKLEAAKERLQGEYNLENLESDFYVGETGDPIARFSFSYEGRTYEMTTIPRTDWVSISSVDHQILANAGNELITVFALVGSLLGVAAVGLTFTLARGLASPLTNVSEAAFRAASGNLSARAEPQGSYETQILAQSYNNLVERVQQLLKEQEESVEQQRQQREELEEEVARLMTDIEQAADGDLTVRAQLMEGDIGIVADLFNAVVENLQDTAQQVKVAASRVSSSLGDNEQEIREVAEGAIAEAEEIQETLNSVEAMNRSIQEVAKNAQKAASIANTALFTAQEGNQAMDQTVESIQSLRATVGETSKKMKQMGESAQKISQVVSLIDEISLKTSLLAINASVEAHRAGELGQGFTAVAEQVEALAEQSASAAKEIAQIVATIQNETQEAIETMEQGTSEVVESSRSVEETKARLAEVVARSEEINNLMQSISDSTVSQAETSQAVSRLMEQVTASSQKRSETSKEVAEAIQETAQVAQSLEASVEQFKVEK
ncbi:methyl-accepting chemotaxis sensory transducer [Halothece sp. PCC 7418]|uniref:methyl-accepting chemotaxis protein n=1 Tax=Halothece sp. (strain PCC 7418) TaxID=65093 RepID=UPI0002A088DB|nr:HAMP domain-containing methyl-accepting chemotaxis protein [Halothece sp. PCC 7418]AFZ45458.1 methyl-accepting chemotaxis sensory transducer [Halothece sp. PCC 7418]